MCDKSERCEQRTKKRKSLREIAVHRYFPRRHHSERLASRRSLVHMHFGGGGGGGGRENCTRCLKLTAARPRVSMLRCMIKIMVEDLKVKKTRFNFDTLYDDVSNAELQS